ncbi:MAG: choice-of-anchor D domain-containing protein, partial [Nitrospinota bacterium]
MRKIIYGLVAGLVLISWWALPGSAFETYTGCADCHGSFRASPYTSLSDGQSWGDDLHDVHRRTMLGGDCNTCHTGSSRTPVFLNSSNGGNGLEPLSCVGCHGRAEDVRGVGGYGAGLRQHHWNAGETVCAGCHDDANPASFTPVGEDVLPPYYASPGTGHNIPTDSCNPPPDFPENYAASTLGLDNDGDSSYDTADPDCQAAEADIDVHPLALDFGVVTTGMSATLAATISNVGTADLTVTGLNITGSADFTLNTAAPATPFTVAPGASVDVPVDYHPADVGDDTGTLEITSDDPDEPTVSVSLTGTGVPPAGQCDIDVNPLALDFGSVQVGTTQTLVTTIGNTGNADCTVNSLTLSGSPDFSVVTAPSTPFTVAPGASVDVTVEYAPSDVGADSGSLEIASDDPDEAVVSVSLTGTGFEPVPDIDVAPLALDFGTVTVGMSATLTTTISNAGTADLTVNSLTLSGSPDFSVVTAPS